MLRSLRFVVPGLIWALACVVPASAQILRELEPVALEYTLYVEGEGIPIGSASISYTPSDTKRGRRLLIETEIQYTVPGEPDFAYEEEASLVCDDEGVVRFETAARAIGKERINTAIRVGEEYHVTTEFSGKKHTKQITAEVRRTNFGLFAGAFLRVPLDEGNMLSDYPLLFPVGGDHQPRQKYREAVMPFSLSPERSVSAIQSRLKTVNRTSDRLWNAAKGHQILLRMEETSNVGTIIYEISTVNGVPAAESELLQ